MATLVTFHAHPDDESIATAGTMARAVASGHRVVLVVATRGEHGEPVPGVLADGELLWQRRVQETYRAAEILGVASVHFLGYHDSGMDGTPTNHADGSFWSADVDEAAARLAAILDAERADVLTVYDERGQYGHPDHIQVHRVGVRAAALARLAPEVFEATVDRDRLQEQLRTAREMSPPDDLPPDLPPGDFDIGVDSHRITTRVDVRPYIDAKRAAMSAHASQIPPDSFFLSMTDDVFAEAFGEEQFMHRGAPAGSAETWVFPD